MKAEIFLSFLHKFGIHFLITRCNSAAESRMAASLIDNAVKPLYKSPAVVSFDISFGCS